MNERLARVIAVYEKKGTVEAISGGGVDAARACLVRAQERLAGAEVLLDNEFWELTYTTAYDAHRTAADALALLHGYRTTAWPGAHVAAHTIAAAVIDRDSAFNDATFAAFRQGRAASEYYDPERPAAKTEADARWAVDQARRACAEVSGVV